MKTAEKSYKDALPTNPESMPQVALDECHSPSKVLAHEEMLRKFVAGEEFDPIHLRIGINGACNMRCNFCNFHSAYEAQFYDRFSFKDAISTEQSITLLSEFAHTGGRAVTFCGSGECTAHRGYAEICHRAKADGLKIGVITNGSRLHHEDVAEAVKQTHTWVRIGMNAGTPETYAKITHHKPEAFQRTLNAIRALREEAVEPDFRIGLNYVVTEENYLEIETAARLAGESGAHYVRFEPEFYSAKGHETIEAQMTVVNELLAAAASYQTDNFEVSIPKLVRGPMDQTDAVEGDFGHCHYSRFVTAVGADGGLYPCPQVHLNSRYLIGDAVGDGYAQVLHGGPRADWEASNPMRTDLCKTCFYRPQNELLELLKRGDIDLEHALASYRVSTPDTLHADFV